MNGRLHARPCDALGISIVETCGKSWHGDKPITNSLRGDIGSKILDGKVKCTSQSINRGIINRNDRPRVRLEHEALEIRGISQLHDSASIRISERLRGRLQGGGDPDIDSGTRENDERGVLRL